MLAASPCGAHGQGGHGVTDELRFDQQHLGALPMKKFSIILMVVGFLLALLGTVDAEITKVIFGSSLFGSGVIALAITQALGKKP
ncbi:MAG: hypothetical protein FWH27_03170 [Planctomycetaceae bacterium]|nr:hypothetical protein [Planctomycetaceae bacterium]